MAEPVKFRYVFRFESGDRQEFNITLDEHLRLINPPENSELPEWTELEVRKCPNCTLDSSQAKHCPAALGISGLLIQFKDHDSIERIEVEVHTAERTYVKQTDLQEGVASMMGIIMPASGCPALSFLRPMARYHLPFSSLQETVIRSVSFFLLRQYFEDGPQQDFDHYLDQLNANYVTLQTVNNRLIERIQLMDKRGDVDKNAIVILQILSQVLTFELKGHLKSLEHLFLTETGV